MFNKLPIEINILIYQYLDGITLKPFDKMSKKIMRSNEVWRENLYRKYSDKKKILQKSNNYYEEYKWKKKLEKHQFNYKRQWTLGCVGRIMPFKKPTFQDSIKIF
jgi:hypothetical protein